MSRLEEKVGLIKYVNDEENGMKESIRNTPDHESDY